MPRYFFSLLECSRVIADPDGIDLPNEAAARAHAETVVTELMRHREVATRSWRLHVRDDRQRVVYEVPFIRLDQTLWHIAPHLRASMENVVLGKGRLDDAIRDVRQSLTQLRYTMAKVSGESHLVPVVLNDASVPDPVTRALS